MAADYAKEISRFNALSPGFTDTPSNRSFKVQTVGRKKLEECIRSAIPMGRLGTVEETAGAVVFPVSAPPSFMTGRALVIAGGEYI